MQRIIFNSAYLDCVMPCVRVTQRAWWHSHGLHKHGYLYASQDGCFMQFELLQNHFWWYIFVKITIAYARNYKAIPEQAWVHIRSEKSYDIASKAFGNHTGRNYVSILNIRTLHTHEMYNQLTKSEGMYLVCYNNIILRLWCDAIYRWT